MTAFFRKLFPAAHVSGSEEKREAHTAVGSIDLKNLRSNAKLRTSGGGLAAASLTGDLDAETSGGSVRIRAL